MRPFKDASGKPWELSITVASAKRVRDQVGVRLYDLIDDGAKKLGELLADPITFTEVVYYLCRESGKLTPEEFCENFVGDTLLAATDAFVEELIDFFQDPKARATLRKMTAKGKLLKTALLERADRQIDQIDPELLAANWKPLSGASPDSSDSTPAPSVSASST